MTDNVEPTTSTEWLERAEQLEEEDELQQALEAVENSIKLNPREGRAWCLKASLLQDLNNPSAAFQTLSEAIQKLPHDADCWYEAGAFQMAHNNPGEAATCFANALDRDKDYPRIHANLGIALLNSCRYNDACEHLLKALEESINDNDRAHLLNRVGESYAGMNELEKAGEYFSKSLELNENDFTAIGNLSLNLIKQNQAEEALKCLEDAIELAPKEGKLHIIKGIALGQLKQEVKSLSEFDLAAKLSPQDPEAWFYKGQYLASIKHYEDALKSYDEGIKVGGLMAQLWFAKANVLHELKRDDEAVTTYRKGLQLTGNLVFLELILVNDKDEPVPSTRMTVETERSVPPERIVQQYINAMVKDKKRNIDEHGLIDGEYKVRLRQMTPDEAAKEKPKQQRQAQA